MRNPAATEALKNAKLWYQSGNEMYRDRLIDNCEYLNEAEQSEVDAKIVKFMPIWGA